MSNNHDYLLNQQIKVLLDENLKQSKETLEIVRKIKRHLLFGQIMNIIYLLMIIVPIVLAIIYLPSLLQNSLNSFLPTDLQGVSLNELLKDKNFLQTLLDLQKK